MWYMVDEGRDIQTLLRTPQDENEEGHLLGGGTECISYQVNKGESKPALPSAREAGVKGEEAGHARASSPRTQGRWLTREGISNKGQDEPALRSARGAGVKGEEVDHVRASTAQI